MKVLLVGEYAWPWYQEACAKALECLGCETVRFGWLDRFKKWVPGKSEPVYRSFAHRVQYRFLAGPTVRGVNRDLVKLAVHEKPDVIWFYNVQMIHPVTVCRLRKRLPGAVFCQYVNDNPFSAQAHKSRWRHFIASIPYFDLHFYFRPGNAVDFSTYGSRQTHLLRAYFIPEEDYPLTSGAIEPRYQCDVVFAGHFEPDGRLESIEAIVAAGHRVNLFGGGWAARAPISQDSLLRKQMPITPVVGEDYRKAISGAKIALCFLSKVNQDTYTRRNFQIPAMRTFMLSEYSEELAGLFSEGIEAEYFRSREELLDKVGFYLRHDASREKIASRGYERVRCDGHDVQSRMRQFLSVVEPWVSRNERLVS